MINHRTGRKVLFYYLSAFSATGGIERFNRCFIKALNELSNEESFAPFFISVYDTAADPRYLSDETLFLGFSKRRLSSALNIIKQVPKADVLILGHINLAVVGLFAKLINPSCKLILISHGIESWYVQTGLKKICLKLVNRILSVSNYTKNQLVLRNHIDPFKISLFPNTIDPFFSIPTVFNKPDAVLIKHKLSPDQPILLTISRLFSSEQFKGYDQVIKALPELILQFPSLVYILAGRYDEAEMGRLKTLISSYKLDDHVILPGYLSSDEITNYYLAADVFVMPSRKEGFGIVFLEALVCGTPVIGGNQDGTVDALKNGSLGTLINPTKLRDIISAVSDILKSRRKVNPFELQQRTLSTYGFAKFKENLRKNLA